MSETAAEVLKLAAELEAMKADRTEKLLAERGMIDNALAALGYVDGAAPKKPRKSVSETARKNMSAAQKARHAKGGEAPYSETTPN